MSELLEAKAEIERLTAENVRLQEAKRAALAIANERSRENVELRKVLAKLIKALDKIISESGEKA